MDRLTDLHERISLICCRIEGMFQPGAKVTVVVRNPSQDVEPHSASVVVSNDQPDLTIEALNYLKTKAERKLSG